MLAFGNGVAAGADHVETDLHLTSDGRIVCFHDHTLDRTTNGAGLVSALSLSELRALDAGHNHRMAGGYPFRGRGLRVPTLGELLATFPEIGVVVDLKQDGLEEPLAAMLDKMKAWNRVIIGSFSDSRLHRMRAASGERAQLSGGPRAVQRWWLASRLGRPGPDGLVALQIPTSFYGLRVLDGRLVEVAHDFGLAVHVWTANQTRHVEWLWGIGVDAVITDRPDIMSRQEEAQH